MSACQGYGQANQITVCVHDAKAYALRGIEAAEDSSATNLGCSNLREKQKEAIISFVSGKDVLVQLPTGNGKSLCYSLLPWPPCVFHIPVTIDSIVEGIGNESREHAIRVALCWLRC